MHRHTQMSFEEKSSETGILVTFMHVPGTSNISELQTLSSLESDLFSIVLAYQC